jgi:large subunit ribosomal protein L23
MKPKRLREVIRRPLLSEKSAALQENRGTICLEVARDANKIDIKRAVESIFGVKVQKVRTMMQHGKLRRLRMAEGRKPDWKKAYVILKKGEKPITYENFVVQEKA